MKLTYKAAGVDIGKGNRLVDVIRPLARSTFDRNVVTDIGSFGAFYRLNTRGMKRPFLVSSTDGVGTKLKIAFMMNRHDTVGIDLVAMCVNDILTSGATPLFFLDYFATGKLSNRQAASVIEGIAEGCRIAGCSLIGGETAEMPGFYAKGEYDLSGFAVGIVDGASIIDGSGIRAGDILIGLPSSGLHSNGYSLVRKLFFELKKYRPSKKIKELGCSLGEELLRPTRIYVRTVQRLINKFTVNGMAHVTGGGLTENLPRLIQKGARLGFEIDRESWPVSPVFDLIKREGGVPDGEMFRTFNMGIGFVLVAGQDEGMKIMRSLKRAGEEAFVIGSVKRGIKGVEYI
jgi:phosphoribosylformylglycinamidine cyclo-ligase